MLNKIKFKYSLKKSFFDIYTIKMGEIFKSKQTNTCHKAQQWFSWIYNFYIYLGVFFILFFMFAYIQETVQNMLVSIPLTFIVHILIEYGLIIFVPLQKIHCWEANIKK